MSRREGHNPIIRFAHGTTVGIDTVIQSGEPDLALLTIANFEDALEMASLTFPQVHNLDAWPPAPLIPRHRVQLVSCVPVRVR
ncbi:hypothetical protein CEW88_19175 (plasmid) [Alloyangia pacifica]|uniref:Uncharacterized protein n=1 Tax=Alloyangia pacifica TaxID=311180 RepID=A0A2U8HJH7_9RHOB|nr:hypothetical protein CEW88_19175 [Alloyangia pacifica]